MAIGRTFQESLQKALRGLETGVDGLTPVVTAVESEEEWAALKRELRMAGSQRLWYVADAFRCGLPFDEVAELTGIDPWFLAQIAIWSSTSRPSRPTALAPTLAPQRCGR
jgi:carbamoyl-phosphate synthase large subunit